MSIRISRRRWLLLAAITTISARPIVAQPPPVGARFQIAMSSLPIPTHSIRLDSARASRVVVTAIAADPRGQYVAAAGDDHVIRILRMSNLTTVTTLAEHRDLIRTLAFDPEGSRLVSAGNDGQLIIWGCDDQFRIRQRMQGSEALACVRFSPDGGDMAAVGFDNEVYVIGRGDRQGPVFECDCKDLRAVAYRDDNQVLAVAGRSGNLHLFDPLSGRLLSEHALHRGRIHDIAFHRHANTAICVAEDGVVTVFDTLNRQLMHRIAVTTGKLFCVEILNSQLIAVAGSDNLIRIVNTDDGTVIRQLEGHTGSVSKLASNGETLFSGSYDASLRRWSLGDFDSSQQRIADGELRFDR